MPRATNTQRHACSHCGLSFPTSASVRRHIAHSRNCYVQWKTQGHARTQHALRPAVQNHWEHLDLTEEDFGVAPPNEAPPPDAGLPDPNEDQVEEDPSVFTCYVQQLHPPVADVLGHADTTFQSMRAFQDTTGGSAYAPFADRDEWKLAEWLICNANQRAMEAFLKLPIVSIHIGIIERIR